MPELNMPLPPLGALERGQHLLLQNLQEKKQQTRVTSDKTINKTTHPAKKALSGSLVTVPLNLQSLEDTSTILGSSRLPTPSVARHMYLSVFFATADCTNCHAASLCSEVIVLFVTMLVYRE
jgi:hypothetical protein